MEEKSQKLNSFDTIEQIKEAEELYNKCLTVTPTDLKNVRYPCLKYVVYNLKLLIVFKDKIETIKASIEEVIEKLNTYKGNKINPTEEKKALEEIINKLDSYKKNAEEEYSYYTEYLIRTAKRFYTSENESTKQVYINTSEEIIKGRIKYFITYEKSLIMFKDNINKLKQFFSI